MTERTLSIDGKEATVSLVKTEDGYAVRIDGRTYDVSNVNFCDGVLSFFTGTRSHVAFVSRNPLGIQMSLGGRDYFVRAGDEGASAAQAAHHHAHGDIVAPMPGSVVALHVAVGDRVRAGDPVVVVESMKMQNEISAPVDGEVKSVSCAVGDQVGFEQPLVEIAPPDGG